MHMSIKVCAHRMRACAESYEPCAAETVISLPMFCAKYIILNVHVMNKLHDWPHPRQSKVGAESLSLSQTLVGDLTLKISTLRASEDGET